MKRHGASGVPDVAIAFATRVFHHRERLQSMGGVQGTEVLGSPERLDGGWRGIAAHHARVVLIPLGLFSVVAWFVSPVPMDRYVTVSLAVLLYAAAVLGCAVFGALAPAGSGFARSAAARAAGWMSGAAFALFGNLLLFAAFGSALFRVLGIPEDAFVQGAAIVWQRVALVSLVFSCHTAIVWESARRAQAWWTAGSFRKRVEVAWQGFSRVHAWCGACLARAHAWCRARLARWR